MRATLALVLTALPAWADPCADAADPAGIALEDAVEAETAADPARYVVASEHWSPDFAFNAMIEVEAPEGAEAVARRLARTLPQIDMALGLAEAGPQIARARSPEITIRLLDSEAETPTEAWTYCEGAVCTVEFFPGFWRGASEEVLAFTLAHEMFHVAQLLAWPEVDHCNSTWWVEGTAEWFANQAVAGKDLTARAGYLAEWDAASAERRLIDMEYEAVAFWFWASERFGPVLPLTLGDFGNAGLNRVEAVSGLLSPDDWVDFAGVYLLGGIAYPDGRAALPAPPLGDVVTAEVIVVEGPDMSLPRAQAVLGPGLWTITVDSASPGSVVLVGNESGGALERVEPGGSVSRFFGCGEGGTVLLAVAGGTNSGTRATFRVAQAEAGCSDCLHGTWEMTTPRDPTNEGFDEAVLGMIQAGGMKMEITHDNDGPRLTLMPDGRYRWEDPGVSRSFASGPDGVAEVITRLVTNEETGTYRQVDGVLGFRKEAALSAGTTSFSAGPLANHETFKDPRAHVPLLPQPYRLVSCEGSQMVWERLVEPDVETTRIFRRVD